MKKTTKKKDSQPILFAAFFCEKVIEEKDGVVSCMRIVDTINLSLPPDAPTNVPSKERPIPIQLFGLLSFRRNEGRKLKHEVELKTVNQSGEEKNLGKHAIKFGKEKISIANLILRPHFLVTEPGVIWTEVFMNGELKMRMPLQVKVNREAPLSASNSPDGTA